MLPEAEKNGPPSSSSAHPLSPDAEDSFRFCRWFFLPVCPSCPPGPFFRFPAKTRVFFPCTDSACPFQALFWCLPQLPHSRLVLPHAVAIVAVGSSAVGHLNEKTTKGIADTQTRQNGEGVPNRLLAGVRRRRPSTQHNPKKLQQNW